jgi:hypothetical protein
MRRHVQACTGLTQEEKDDIDIAEQAHDQTQGAGTKSNKKRKLRLDPDHTTLTSFGAGSSSNGKLGKAVPFDKQAADRALVHFVASQAKPFRAVNSSSSQQFARALNPRVQYYAGRSLHSTSCVCLIFMMARPFFRLNMTLFVGSADESTLRCTLLPNEAKRIQDMTTSQLQNKSYITVAFDAWSDARMRSVLGAAALDEDDQCYPLGLEPLKGSHTGQMFAGESCHLLSVLSSTNYAAQTLEKSIPLHCVCLCKANA